MAGELGIANQNAGALQRQQILTDAAEAQATNQSTALQLRKIQTNQRLEQAKFLQSINEATAETSLNKLKGQNNISKQISQAL